MMEIEAEPIDDDDHVGVPRWEPTPEEIAEACRQIQSEWSPEEERRRRAVQPSGELYLGGVVKVHAGE